MPTKESRKQYAFFCALFCAVLALVAALPLSFLHFPSSKAAAENAKGTGNFTNLVVFVKFQGEEEFVDDRYGKDVPVREVVENSYTRAAYSVQDYYARASQGKVQMQTQYLFAPDGGSLTLAHSRGYYCEKDDSNPEGYESGEYALRLAELRADWANAIEGALREGARPSDYLGKTTFSLDGLDKNGDGYADALTVIYKYSNQYSVSWKGCLWNYQSYYSGVTFQEGERPITSNAYFQYTANFTRLYTDERGCTFASLNTLIHETGHIFGLKDLYNSNSSSPVYYMSAMANAISPVPQGLSSKEREALGWLEDDQVVTLREEGTYELAVTADQATGVLAYKIPLQSKNKTVYLEYRDFTSDAQRYDKQAKTVYDADGNLMRPITIRSGLVCYLADSDVRFPSNLYAYAPYWSYEVLGGTYATKTDAALSVGESRYLSSRLSVEVLSIENGKLIFRLSGSDFSNERVHAPLEIDETPSTCQMQGVRAHYRCDVCNKYFLDEACTKETTLAALRLPFAAHSPSVLKGVAPTCQSGGYTDGEFCSVCKEVLVERTPIAALPHSPSAWITVREPTPEQDGLAVVECTDCHTDLETKPLVYIPPDNSGSSDSSSSSDSSGSSEPPDSSIPDDSSGVPKPPESSGTFESPDTSTPSRGCSSQALAFGGVWGLAATFAAIALRRKRR